MELDFVLGGKVVVRLDTGVGDNKCLRWEMYESRHSLWLILTLLHIGVCLRRSDGAGQSVVGGGA